MDIDSSWCTLTATFPIRNNSTKDTFDSSVVIDKALKNNTGFLNKNDYEMMAAAVAGRNSSLSEDSVTIDDGNLLIHFLNRFSIFF